MSDPKILVVCPIIPYRIISFVGSLCRFSMIFVHLLCPLCSLCALCVLFMIQYVLRTRMDHRNITSLANAL